MKILIVLIITFISYSSYAATICSQCSGKNCYYVSTTGNDKSTGKTVSTAWKTIQHAVYMSPVYSHVICVLPGVYNENNDGIYIGLKPSNHSLTESPAMLKAGTLGNEIVFQSATLYGAKIHGFTIVGGAYIKIDGFEISQPTTAISVNGVSFPNIDPVVWGNDSFKGFGILLHNSQHCIINNNYIHDTAKEGISLRTWNDVLSATYSSYHIVSNNKIERVGTYAGIFSLGVGHLLSNNDISHVIQFRMLQQDSSNKWVGFIIPDTTGQDADGIKFEGQDQIIRGNYIHDILCHDIGNDNAPSPLSSDIKPNPHIDGVSTYGVAYNTLIENNIILLPSDNDSSTVGGDCGHQAAMIGTDFGIVNGMAIQNNVISSYRGFNMQRSNSNNSMSNLYFYFNTFHDIPDYGIELGFTSGDAKIKNNIFYNVGIEGYDKLPIYVCYPTGTGSSAKCRTDIAYSYGNLEITKNAHYLSSGTPFCKKATSMAAFPFNIEYCQIDPLFVSGNFKLQSISPMIGQAVDVGVLTDLEGFSRTLPYDLGAYEYH